MKETLYRRPLPAGAIAFSSLAGRELFAEALACGGLNGYFPLAEQFHTQSDPAFCGLGSLVVALNALGIDPGRLWKGPWRWFAEDLLDCCVPLAEVKKRGLDLDELACLARCNGAEVVLHRAQAATITQFREALMLAASGRSVLLVAYDRSALGQTGAGHFSPVGGYHPSKDLVLILDVARFKYPPHWVPAEELWRGMASVDSSTGLSRGWLSLRGRAEGVALGFSVSCVGDNWQGLADRLRTVVSGLGPERGLEDLARAVLPLTKYVSLRTPSAPAHQQALNAAREVLRQLPAYPRVVGAVGEADAEAVLLILLASAHRLGPEQQVELESPRGNELLAAELAALEAQLAALWIHAQSREQYHPTSSVCSEGSSAKR